ncbi:Uncharacterised protein [Mycobacteroides abscessus subsp. abscessus]|nr:Uncharacterised protein [Mycobacteroides abscessus subsp. abscessus]
MQLLEVWEHWQSSLPGYLALERLSRQPAQSKNSDWPGIWGLTFWWTIQKADGRRK